MPKPPLPLGIDAWYRHVTLVGRVIALVPDTELEAIDRLSRHYMGNPYSQRPRHRARTARGCELAGEHRIK